MHHQIVELILEIFRNEKILTSLRVIGILIAGYILSDVLHVKEKIIKMEEVQTHHQKSISDAFGLTNQLPGKLDIIQSKCEGKTSKLEDKYDKLFDELQKKLNSSLINCAISRYKCENPNH